MIKRFSTLITFSSIARATLLRGDAGPGPTDRKLQTACSIVETLFDDDVACSSCNMDMESGLVEAQCDYLNEVCIDDNICFKPSFEGAAQGIPSDFQGSVTSKLCANGFSFNNVLLDALGAKGTLCLVPKFDVSLENGIQSSVVNECSVEAFGLKCNNSCAPCNDGSGIVFQCEGLPVEACLPVSLPTLDTLPATQIEDILNGLDIESFLLGLIDSEEDNDAQAEGTEEGERRGGIVDWFFNLF